MGKTQFDKNWLQQTDANGTLFGTYIIFDNKVLNEVYCKICNRKKICFENRGFASLKDHAKSTKHRELSKIVGDANQLRLVKSDPTKISVNTQNDVSIQDESLTNHPKASTSKETQQTSLHLHISDGDITEKEVIWVIHSVMKHSSFYAAEKDSNVLKMIAPNDLKGFSLYRQKMTDMVNEAIGPYFRDLFLKDVRGEYFSFLFDETEGSNKRKELEITIKYYSKRLQRLMFFHLDSIFLGKATADILLEKILQALEKAQLPLMNLVMVGRDGPKVNQSLERKINSKLVGERGFELVSTGSCPAHIVHNGIKYALKEYGSEASELAKVVYYYFVVPARWDQFVSECKTKPKKFVKFVETRWAQLGDAATVLLENYSELKILKIKLARMDEKRSTFHEKVIVRILSLADFKLQLLFVIDLCKSAESLIKFLETNDMILFDVYDKMKMFMTAWLSKIYRVEEIEQVFEQKCLDKTGYIQNEEIIIPKRILDENFDNKLLTNFKAGMKKNVSKLITYLLENKVPHNFFNLVSYLKPIRLYSTNSERNVMKLAEVVNFKLDSAKIFEEIVNLKALKLWELQDDLMFYENVFKTNMFPEFNKLFRIVVTISHSNAEAERRFSTSKLIMCENRASMSEELFNHRKNILNGMLFFKNEITDFEVPKELLIKAKFARQAHTAKQELKKEEQRKNDEKRKEKADKRKEIEKQESIVKRKREANDELIDIITEQVKKLKGDNPQIACLKVIVDQRSKMLLEEKKEEDKLNDLKAKK